MSAMQSSLSTSINDRRCSYQSLKTNSQAKVSINDRKRFRKRQQKKMITNGILVEEQTKAKFQETIDDGLIAVGCGVREKKVAFMNVKVYAVAFYVEKSKYTKQLLDGDFTKAIAIELARDCASKDFYAALDEAVRPRIARIATDMATKEDCDGNFMTTTAEEAEEAEERALDDLDELKRFMSGKDKLPSGEKIAFVFNAKESAIALEMRAFSTTKTFKSHEFARALLDVYVGDDPISPSAKDNFLAGVAALESSKK